MIDRFVAWIRRLFPQNLQFQHKILKLLAWIVFLIWIIKPSGGSGPLGPTNKIYDIIIADWRVTKHDIVTELDISKDCPCSHPQLTSSLQCVSLLGPKDSWAWLEMDSAHHIKGQCCHFWGRSWEFSLWFLTVDEPWVHNFQPKMKEQLKQCKQSGSLNPGLINSSGLRIHNWKSISRWRQIDT